MECGSWSVVGLREDGTTIVHPLYCRSWQCARCARLQKRRLLQRLDGVKAHTFMTLTCNPRAHQDPTLAFTAMSLAVNHLMKRIRRRWPGCEVEYFLVWERTAAGWPHAHLMLRAPFIPQNWLSAQWRDLTGAPVVDIRPVHSSDHLLAYLSKHLVKAPSVPPGMKHYRFSRHFLSQLVPKREPGELRVDHWQLQQASPASLATAFSDAGYTISEHPDGSYTCFPHGHPDAPVEDCLSVERAHQKVLA